MKHLKASVPVLCVFCLALLVRIVYNITIAAGYIPIFDAAIYNNLAHYLVVIHCYYIVPQFFVLHSGRLFSPPFISLRESIASMHACFIAWLRDLCADLLPRSRFFWQTYRTDYWWHRSNLHWPFHLG